MPDKESILGPKTREYRIAPGQKHYMRGSGKGITKYLEGQKVSLTDSQAKGIKDKLIPVEQTADELTKEASVEDKAPYAVEDAGGKMFNVLRKSDGKAMNEEPLSKTAAKKLVKQLDSE